MDALHFRLGIWNFKEYIPLFLVDCDFKSTKCFYFQICSHVGAKYCLQLLTLTNECSIGIGANKLAI